MKNKLYRSKKDIIFTGVCGGIAEYFGWETNIVRILAVLICLSSSGYGAILYVLLWLTVGKNPTQKNGKKTKLITALDNFEKKLNNLLRKKKK